MKTVQDLRDIALKLAQAREDGCSIDKQVDDLSYLVNCVIQYLLDMEKHFLSAPGPGARKSPYDAGARPKDKRYL